MQKQLKRKRVSFTKIIFQFYPQKRLEKLGQLPIIIGVILLHFVSIRQVSLDSRVREIVNRNMVEPTPHTFDEAQLQIYTLMHRDSYPR